MPPSEKDLKYMWDMLGNARAVIELTEGWTRERYLDDKVRRLAMERAIEIIGEAARHVSREGRTAAPGVAWSAIVATRHILAHEYGDIDHEQLWRIATVHVPPLVDQLQFVLDQNPPAPESQKDPSEP